MITHHEQTARAFVECGQADLAKILVGRLVRGVAELEEVSPTLEEEGAVAHAAGVVRGRLLARHVAPVGARPEDELGEGRVLFDSWDGANKALDRRVDAILDAEGRPMLVYRRDEPRHETIHLLSPAHRLGPGLEMAEEEVESRPGEDSRLVVAEELAAPIHPARDRLLGGTLSSIQEPLHQPAQNGLPGAGRVKAAGLARGTLRGPGGTQDVACPADRFIEILDVEAVLDPLPGPSPTPFAALPPHVVVAHQAPGRERHEEVWPLWLLLGERRDERDQAWVARDRLDPRRLGVRIVWVEVETNEVAATARSYESNAAPTGHEGAGIHGHLADPLPGRSGEHHLGAAAGDPESLIAGAPRR